MPSNSWLHCQSPVPTAPMRLLCFPCAGGGTAPYFAWPGAFSPVAEVHVAQLPGRERRRNEPLLTSIDAVLMGLLPAIESLSDRPFAFFGHSMGALVAFEIARRLLPKTAANLRHLFLAAREPPGGPNPPLHHLSDEQLVAMLDARYGGIPEIIRADPDLLRFFLPIIRADLAILSSHKYKESTPLNCPITVLGGRRDLSTSERVLQEWQQLTLNRMELRMYDGDHFFPQSQRNAVTSDIRETLNKDHFLSMPPAGRDAKR